VGHWNILTVPLVSNPPAATTISIYHQLFAPSSAQGLKSGKARLTGWKARLAALGMNPTGRCGPPTFGLSGIDNLDKVLGFVGSENP
jgi:hypothetical protein